MEERPHMDPREITTKHVDIQKILANKGVKLPHWAVRMMERLLHADEINATSSGWTLYTLSLRATTPRT